MKKALESNCCLGDGILVTPFGRSSGMRLIHKNEYLARRYEFNREFAIAWQEIRIAPNTEQGH